MALTAAFLVTVRTPVVPASAAAGRPASGPGFEAVLQGVSPAPVLPLAARTKPVELAGVVLAAKQTGLTAQAGAPSTAPASGAVTGMRPQTGSAAAGGSVRPSDDLADAEGQTAPSASAQLPAQKKAGLHLPAGQHVPAARQGAVPANSVSAVLVPAEASMAWPAAPRTMAAGHAPAGTAQAHAAATPAAASSEVQSQLVPLQPPAAQALNLTTPSWGTARAAAATETPDAASDADPAQAASAAGAGIATQHPASPIAAASGVSPLAGQIRGVPPASGVEAGPLVLPASAMPAGPVVARDTENMPAPAASGGKLAAAPVSAAPAQTALPETDSLQISAARLAPASAAGPSSLPAAPAAPLPVTSHAKATQVGQSAEPAAASSLPEAAEPVAAAPSRSVASEKRTAAPPIQPAATTLPPAPARQSALPVAGLVAEPSAKPLQTENQPAAVPPGQILAAGLPAESPPLASGAGGAVQPAAAAHAPVASGPTQEAAPTAAAAATRPALRGGAASFEGPPGAADPAQGSDPTLPASHPPAPAVHAAPPSRPDTGPSAQQDADHGQTQPAPAQAATTAGGTTPLRADAVSPTVRLGKTAAPDISGAAATAAGVPGVTDAGAAAAPATAQAQTTGSGPSTGQAQAASGGTDAAAPTATPAGTPVAQLAQAVTSLHAAADGSSHVTIKLDPVELGHLQIRISRGQDGSASVNVAVERPETLARLQGDLGHLHEALDRAGLPEQRNLTLHLAAGDQPGSQSPGAGTGNMSQGGFQQGARQERQPGSHFVPDLAGGQLLPAAGEPAPSSRQAPVSGVNITA